MYDTPIAIVKIFRNRIIIANEKIQNTPRIFEYFQQSMRRRCEKKSFPAISVIKM